MSLTSYNRRARRQKAVLQSTNTSLMSSQINNYLGMNTLEVIYFNKQVGENETVLEFDINEPSHLQNFIEIKNLTIYQQEEIPTIGDINDIRGSGIIDLPIKPTVGDIFFLDIGSYFLFSVIEVKRVTYNSSQIFRVTYRAIEKIETEEKLNLYLERLRSGTVETLVYDPQAIQKDLPPLLTEEVFVTLQDLMDLREYAERFIIEKISIKGIQPMAEVKGFGVYDPHLITFIDNTLSFASHSMMKSIPDIGYRPMEEYTILEALLEVNPYISHKWATINAYGLQYRDIVMEVAIGFTEQYIDWAKLPDRYEDGSFVPTCGLRARNPDEIKEAGNELIPTLFDETYILSNEFYGVPKLPRIPNPPVETDDESNDDTGDDTNNDNNDEGGTDDSTSDNNDSSGSDAGSDASGRDDAKETLSVLELSIQKFFESKAPDLKGLRDLLKYIPNMTYNQMVYYGPIIIFLTDNALLSRANGYKGVSERRYML